MLILVWNLLGFASANRGRELKTIVTAITDGACYFLLLAIRYSERFQRVFLPTGSNRSGTRHHMDLLLVLFGLLFLVAIAFLIFVAVP